MSRRQPARQRGFGLLVFALMASVIALSIVLGYSGLLTREEANQRPAKLQRQLEQYREQLEGYYRQNARLLDHPVTGSGVTAEYVLGAAGVPLQRGLRAALSQLLTTDGQMYFRRLVLYYPSETDESNPPDLARFQSTGVFASCVNPALACAPRLSVLYDSLEIHQQARLETERRLKRVALKAQAFFKARMLQDPEKNISVNYFRAPFGGCLYASDLSHPTARSLSELECLDSFTPLATLSGVGGWEARTNLAQVLGLAPEELVSGWGSPIEASNLLDSETAEPPFTMVFRAQPPMGPPMVVRAVQQI